MRNQLSSKGFTLVEVLVATGLVALLSVVMTTLMVKMQKDVSVYSAKSGVESMRNQVRMNAINGASILRSASLPENTAFGNCLKQSSPCTTTKAPFKLVDAMGVPLATAQGTYYDLQGKNCDTWSINCPMKITSQMQLICSGTDPSKTTCDKAGAMNVFVQIDYHEDLSKRKGVELRPITDTITVALTSLYGTTLTNEITNENSGDLVCDAGSVMTGVDATGKVKCVIYAGGPGGGGGGNNDGNGRDGDGGGGGQGKDGGGDGSSGGGMGGSCNR